MASPYPQPAWYGPAPLGPPAPPSAVSRAVLLMYAGAGLAVVYGVVYGLARHNLASGILFGIFYGLLWLWMAWKSKAGRNWARALSSVFFGVHCVGALGTVTDHKWAPAFVVTVFLLEWGVGLAALILLWRPESSQFFEAARQARLTAAPVPPYQGAAHPAGTADREQLLGDTHHPESLTSRDNLAMAHRAAWRPGGWPKLKTCRSVRVTEVVSPG